MKIIKNLIIVALIGLAAPCTAISNPFSSLVQWWQQRQEQKREQIAHDNFVKSVKIFNKMKCELAYVLSPKIYSTPAYFYGVQEGFIRASKRFENSFKEYTDFGPNCTERAWQLCARIFYTTTPTGITLTQWPAPPPTLGMYTTTPTDIKLTQWPATQSNLWS